MTNLIKIYVGEVIGTMYDGKYIVVSSYRWTYRMFSTVRDVVEKWDWEMFKQDREPVSRLGRLGQDITEGDDWLCHDGRCFPSTFSGGNCQGCFYNRSGSSQKRYYEPGDTVWVIDERRKAVVVDTSLFLKSSDNSVPLQVENCSTFYLQEKLRQEKNGKIKIEWSTRFRFEGETRYYKWDELRCIKRKRHTLNPEQLAYICSDLCFFGPYGKNSQTCFECETGRIRRHYLKE